MKIAYLNTFYSENNSSGGTTHIREFIEETIKAGHEIYTGKYNQHLKVKQIPENIIERIAALLNYDVFYIRYEGAITKNMQFSKFPQQLLLKNALLVWEFNTIPEYILTRGRNKVDVQTQKQLLAIEAEVCDLAICVTEEMSDYCEKTIGFKRTLTGSNGSNPNHFKPGLPIPERMKFFKDKINVVWSGSLYLSWNDTELLIKTAINLWQNGRSDICFHMIGEFPPGIVQEIPPNVFLYGKQPYEALPNWLSAMDIGVVLYKLRQNEFGSPIKLFDYLSSGLAVISTPHSQTGRILGEIGQEEFMLKSEDSKELSDLILGLADNPQKLIRFKKDAREIILNKYNWANSVNKILSELETLLTSKRKLK